MGPVLASRHRTVRSTRGRRRMSKKRRFAGDARQLKIEMTPMIDVVFQLLIFFMCATKFKTI